MNQKKNKPIRTRNRWTVKPYTRIQPLRTSYRRQGKGRTPRDER